MLFFSVVVPTYRRQAQLRACLEGLARMNYPHDRYDVIVVDDGGAEDLEDVLAPLRQRLDLMLIVQSNAGPAAARNRGAQRAKGQYLAFIDDDCVPDPEWLAALAKRLRITPDHLMGGRTVNALPKNVFSTASQVLITYLCGYFDGQRGRSRLFTSNNLAVAADAFRTIGGFDTRFPRAAGEDREFCDRWGQSNRPSSYAPDAEVSHAHAMTLRTFWRQHFEYGRAAAWCRHVRAHRRQEPVQVEPLRFYLELLRFPFWTGEVDRAWICSALLAFSQMANASGFVWSSISARVTGRKPADRY
jgi:GT2 family glycosyltransferase